MERHHRLKQALCSVNEPIEIYRLQGQIQAIGMIIESLQSETLTEIAKIETKEDE